MVLQEATSSAGEDIIEHFSSAGGVFYFSLGLALILLLVLLTYTYCFPAEKKKI